MLGKADVCVRPCLATCPMEARSRGQPCPTETQLSGLFVHKVKGRRREREAGREGQRHLLNTETLRTRQGVLISVLESLPTRLMFAPWRDRKN